MLSFSLRRDGPAIRVHCDADGMGVLLNKLAGLLETGGGQVHLFADQLSGTSPSGEKGFSEVVIDFSDGGLAGKEE